MITINDIAKQAGVSKTTVSRVMTKPELVKPATRDKVMSIIKKQHFIPSNIAQNLYKGSSKTIGIVIDELANNFFLEILEGVDRELTTQGYSLMIYASQWDQSKELQQVTSLISKRVSGIILAPTSSDTPAIQQMLDFGIPFVVINCRPDNPLCEYVTCDNLKGGRIVGEYCNRLDADQNIVVTGFPHQTCFEREEGFKETINPRKKLISYDHIRTFEDGQNLVDDLITKDHVNKIKTSIFVTNDNVAISVADALRKRNINIPEQVSVIGFDDILLSGLCTVDLSTVRQDTKRMGQEAAANLIDIIENVNHQRHNTIIDPILVRRSSSR